MCLYNQDIEGTSINKGVNKVIEILIENNYLKQDYFLILTKYKSPSYNKIKESIMKSLNSFNATVTLQEENKTLEEKGKDLSITTIEENELLKEIELYSKNVIRHYKNNVSGTIQIKPEVITEETSREYADNVYKKIENYVRTNNIINQIQQLQGVVQTVEDANKLVVDNISNITAVTQEITAEVSSTLETCEMNQKAVYKVRTLVDELSRDAEELKQE